MQVKITSYNIIPSLNFFMMGVKMEYDVAPVRPQSEVIKDGFVQKCDGGWEFKGVQSSLGLVYQRETVSPSNLGGRRVVAAGLGLGLK